MSQARYIDVDVLIDGEEHTRMAVWSADPARAEEQALMRVYQILRESENPVPMSRLTARVIDPSPSLRTKIVAIVKPKSGGAS